MDALRALPSRDRPTVAMTRLSLLLSFLVMGATTTSTMPAASKMPNRPKENRNISAVLDMLVTPPRFSRVSIKLTPVSMEKPLQK